MENSTLEKVRALVLGGTGAVGNLLVESLLSSNHYSEVGVIARRKIDKWYEHNHKDKLKFMMCSDLEILKQDNDKIIEALNNDLKYDTIFCCLGTLPDDEETFRKVDYDYVIMIAALCEKFNIPHFSLLSSKNSDPTSIYLYLRVKGEAEIEVIKKNIKKISIFRPPLINDRPYQRTAEKVLSIIPFYSQMGMLPIVQSMINEDLIYHLTDDDGEIRNAATIHEMDDLKRFSSQVVNVKKQ